jgi:hypothetical protein
MALGGYIELLFSNYPDHRAHSLGRFNRNSAASVSRLHSTEATGFAAACFQVQGVEDPQASPKVCLRRRAISCSDVLNETGEFFRPYREWPVGRRWDAASILPR